MNFEKTDANPYNRNVRDQQKLSTNQKYEEAPIMNLTHNDKIEQIKDETLVVGVDIGKETNYARALDNRGRELKKHVKFTNSREGFGAFDKWVSEIS